MTKGNKKRKNVQFQDAEDEGREEINQNQNKDRITNDTKSRRFKDKHSLDSDEELEEEKVEDGSNVLLEDDIEGQEDETIRHDGEITVTPFNLKDELEEGHFDAQGNYIANVDTEATDEWLESVDWRKVENKQFKEEEEEMEEDEPPALAPLKIMQDMIEIMKPGENVLKCLRRLGGNKKPVSSADRWKKKKQNVQEPVDEKVEQDKANLLKLTGLADDLLQGGDFQIYEKTFEQMKYEIDNKLSQFLDADKDDELETVFKKPRLDSSNDEKTSNEKKPLEDSDDDELETAFARTDNKEKVNGKNIIGPFKPNNEKTKDEVTDVTLTDEVCWYYKLEDNDKSELQGPFTSTVMLQMQEDGMFGGGVFCRKVGSEGSFYNSKRVDFDLYT